MVLTREAHHRATEDTEKFKSFMCREIPQMKGVSPFVMIDFGRKDRSPKGALYEICQSKFHGSHGEL